MVMSVLRRAIFAPRMNLPPTGALTLVARDDTWNSYPGHLTNAAQVLAGTHAAAYEARPTWTSPIAPAATATNGAFSLYRTALDRNHAYSAATSTLAQALQASIGPDNKVSLEATFDPAPLYSLTPREIVDAMFAQHGTTNPQDLVLLRAPLHEPLPALANLERHMNSFLLASKKLTTAGQGKTPYEYFEIFLETLKGFPVVGQCLPAYYAVNPTMATRNLGTLFPYLKSQLDFLLAQSTASPFSGAAIPGLKQKNKKKKKKGPKGDHTAQWGPYCRVMYAAAPPHFAGGMFEAAVTPASNLQEAHAEIHRLHQVMAQHGNLSAAYGHFGPAMPHTPPTVPHTPPTWCWRSSAASLLLCPWVQRLPRWA